MPKIREISLASEMPVGLFLFGRTEMFGNTSQGGSLV